MSGNINRYIDPLTDFGFQHLFCNSLNKNILIKFLEAVFEGKKEISGIELHSRPVDLAEKDMQKAISFLTCIEKNGRQFSIIIRRIEEHSFRQSSREFLSGFFKNLEPSGQTTAPFPLREHYLLGLLNFGFGDCEDLYYRDVSFTKIDIKRNPIGKLAFKFMEIPRFCKSEQQLDTDMDKWFYALRHFNRLKEIPPCFRGEVFQQLFKLMEVAGLSNEDISTYAAELKSQRDENRSFKIYNPEKAAERVAEKEIMEGHLAVEKKNFFLEIFKLGYENGFEAGMLEITNEMTKPR